MPGCFDAHLFKEETIRGGVECQTVQLNVTFQVVNVVTSEISIERAGYFRRFIPLGQTQAVRAEMGQSGCKVEDRIFPFVQEHSLGIQLPVGVVDVKDTVETVSFEISRKLDVLVPIPFVFESIDMGLNRSGKRTVYYVCRSGKSREQTQPVASGGIEMRRLFFQKPNATVITAIMTGQTPESLIGQSRGAEFVPRGLSRRRSRRPRP